MKRTLLPQIHSFACTFSISNSTTLTSNTFQEIPQRVDSLFVKIFSIFVFLFVPLSSCWFWNRVKFSNPATLRSIRNFTITKKRYSMVHEFVSLVWTFLTLLFMNSEIKRSWFSSQLTSLCNIFTTEHILFTCLHYWLTQFVV